MPTMADKLASPNLLGGLSAEDLAQRFGRRGPASGNPVNAIRAQDVRGIGGIANAIGRFSTNPRLRAQFSGTPQQQRQSAAENVNRVNSTLYPTSQGVNAFRTYVNRTYPQGDIPQALREAGEADVRGGINDSGLASAVQRDVSRRQRSGMSVPTQRTAPVMMGNSGATVNIGTPLPGYLQDVADAPGDLGQMQNRAALGPTGPGFFTPALAATGLAFGLPAVGLLSGGAGGVGSNSVFRAATGFAGNPIARALRG